FAGSPSHVDGQRGTFTVNPTDKTGTDFRAKGRLVYTRERYLRHAGTHEPFIKGGAGSPENLLAYADFDGTMDNGGPDALPGDGLHRYGPHVDDWTDGDPQWQAGKGKGLIGGLNYLAAQDINAIYLLLMNWRGDGDDVWPWPAPEQQDRFDVSKLDQWEIVFAHMDQLGIAPNMLVQETENDTLFDGGSLGRLRKLYFREMVARFGHHLGVTWNLGEENNNSTAERIAFADYIAALDPYDHPIVVHNHVHLVPETYDPLLGVEPFTGPSFQLANPGSVHSRTIQYLDLAEASGRPWVVPIDEIGHYSIGASPDGEGNNHDEIRRDVLWGNLMAGGAGVEWYFGYTRPHADLNLEDWRSRHDLWRQTATALNFFRTYLPFDEMQHHDGLTWPDEDYVLAKPGEVYAVYLPAGGTTALEVKDYPNRTFSVQWFDPRKGSPLMAGSISFVQGGSNAVMLGTPPYEPNADWVILVRAVDR
ncbi:MAG: putative collagen-binding domain-containing protein, partial [Bacteroidota bacterium]